LEEVIVMCMRVSRAGEESPADGSLCGTDPSGALPAVPGYRKCRSMKIHCQPVGEGDDKKRGLIGRWLYNLLEDI
ncbi:hypothetical protein SK128_015125, partial [Halocaridina rubra]